MNKFLYTIGLALIFSLGVMAQQTVTGVVKDALGNPIPGVRVSKVGELRHNDTTDGQGVFSLNLNEDDYIELNYADILLKRVKVNGTSLNVMLDAKKDAAVDLGFMKRTEQTQTQAVSAIYADLLEKNATSTNRLNNALYGLIPGLHTTQNVGWNAGAGLTTRGSGAPLVLIDGFQRGMSNIVLEEIESIQLLKDGASTALWGGRAANGVILINTKRGIHNSFDIDVNYRHGFDFPINQPDMADAYTYAMAQNEALYYDGLPLQYNKKQLEQFKNGTNPYYCPNVDWVKEGTRNFSENNQFNVMLRGGGKRLRYMAFLDYQNKFGLLNDDYTHYSERYNSQIRNYDLNLRINLDADLTSTTQMKFSIYGNIGESKNPDSGGIDGMFRNLYHVPAAAFPIKTLNNHWGSNTLFKRNPIADIADVGYAQNNRRLLEGDLRLTQDLSKLLKGLNAEIAVAYDNVATFTEYGSKSYQYEVNYTSSIGLPISEYYGTDSPFAISSSKLSEQFIRVSMEGKLNYERAFKKHQIGASLIYRQEMTEPLGLNTSNYRQSILGFAGYNYDNRYMLDLVGHYYGTSVLLKGDKFRFYPAVSVGWNLANESFLKDASWLDLLKVRASWGQSANDNISYGLGNYFWVSGGGYPFKENNERVSGLKEGNLPVSRLDLETATKYNVGVDLRLWKNFTATAELYYDRRTDILTSTNKVSSMLGISPAYANIGEIEMRGVELSLGWNQRHKDFSYYVNANWALNDSEMIEDGQAYQPHDYLYTKGHKVGQLFGLEATGYFRDEQDIVDSPSQTFSVVRPGDVKYKDQNDDKKIDAYDKVPIGKSSIPEMVMGLNLGFEYKGFGIDMAFNGVSGITKQLTVESVHRPLTNNNRNIATWYLKDKIRWTEATKDIANMPRLSTLSNANNYQTSTQWIEDGSFFKLRNLNVHYTLPQRWTSKLKMEKLKVYAKALNVFSIDKIKNFNSEDIALGYPDLFSVYLGVNINF